MYKLLMSKEWVLKEYFEEDKKIDQNGYQRSSVLLTLIRDLQFCLNYPKRWRTINLTKEQISELENVLPNFASLLLFCSGIDLIARVFNKITNDNAKGLANGKLFKDSAKQFFDFSEEESSFLWDLRCSVAHQYTILGKVQLIKDDSSRMLILDNGIYKVYLAPSLTRLGDAKEKLYKYITEQDKEIRSAYLDYLAKYGFIYSPTDLIS
jgi:hypothetical protein